MATAKQSEQSRLGRQKILDAMQRHGWLPVSTIVKLSKENIRVVAARLTVMRRVEEVESKVEIINGNEVILFRALVKETRAKMPPNEAAVQAMHNANKAIAASSEPSADTDTPTTYLPGRIIHNGSRRRVALASGRGQGAIVVSRGIASGADWV